MQVTACAELLMLLTDGIGPATAFRELESHYEADGITATIRDVRTGQDYRVEIKPVREHDDKAG